MPPRSHSPDASGAFSICRAAQEQPDALAAVTPAGALTYRALADRVRARMAALTRACPAALSEPSRLLVAVTAPPTLSTFEKLLALVELRVPLLPLSPNLTQAEREALQHQARWNALWHERGLERCAPAAASPGSSLFELCGSSLCVIATSGSTGRPKLAVLSRQACAAAVNASAVQLPLAVGDRWLLCLPLAHVGGLSVLLRCLAARASVALDFSVRGPQLPDAVRQSAATHLSVVPAQLHQLLEGHREPGAAALGALKAVLVGGAQAPRPLLLQARQLGIAVRATYGMTETASQLATARAAPAAPDRLFPLPHAELRLTSNERIEVRGASLFSGYLDHEARDATRVERIRPDQWWATSDRGQWGPGGELIVLGRADRVIITGGENVSPEEVEAALEQCQGVAEACVFSVPDPRFGQRVVAALAAAPGAHQAIRQELPVELARHLAPHKRPREIALFTKLPHTEAGKIDRRRAEQAARPRLAALRPPSAPAEALPPRDDDEV